MSDNLKKAVHDALHNLAAHAFEAGKTKQSFLSWMDSNGMKLIGHYNSQIQDDRGKLSNELKTIDIPNDQVLTMKIVALDHGHLGVLIQPEGCEDHAWMITMGDFITMIQNPGGIVVPHAQHKSRIQVPDNKIVTN